MTVYKKISITLAIVLGGGWSLGMKRKMGFSLPAGLPKEVVDHA